MNALTVAEILQETFDEAGNMCDWDRENDEVWEECYSKIFSASVSQKIWKMFPDFKYYDPRLDGHRATLLLPRHGGVSWLPRWVTPPLSTARQAKPVSSPRHNGRPVLLHAPRCGCPARRWHRI